MLMGYRCPYRIRYTQTIWCCRNLCHQPTVRRYKHEKSYSLYRNKANGLIGTACIGRVTYSKTGSTLYYNDKTFRSLGGAGFKSNYYDVATGDHYWISGCKKRGSNRLYGERIPVEIDEEVRREYWTRIRNKPEKQREKYAEM